MPKPVRIAWVGGYVATANLLGLEEVASGKFERRRDAWEDLAWRLVGKLDAANLRLATDTKPDGEIRNENWSLKSLLQEAEARAVTAEKESAALRNQVEALRDEVEALKFQLAEKSRIWASLVRSAGALENAAREFRLQ